VENAWHIPKRNENVINVNMVEKNQNVKNAAVAKYASIIHIGPDVSFVEGLLYVSIILDEARVNLVVVDLYVSIIIYEILVNLVVVIKYVSMVFTKTTVTLAEVVKYVSIINTKEPVNFVEMRSIKLYLGWPKVANRTTSNTIAMMKPILSHTTMFMVLLYNPTINVIIAMFSFSILNILRI
jgi:hypothetical protein